MILYQTDYGFIDFNDLRETHLNEDTVPHKVKIEIEMIRY